MRTALFVLLIGALRVIVTQSSGQNSPWTISTCAIAKSAGKRIGTGPLQYTIPRRARLKKVKDVDYFEYLVASKSGDSRSFLTLLWGVNESLSPPPLSSDSRRVVNLSGDLNGLDSRGATVTEGVEVKWRFVKVGNGVAEYKNATAENVVYFDQIIDSACFVAVY